MTTGNDMNRFDYSLIPERMHNGLWGYFAYRRPAGDFLMAVLKNDLMEAVSRADDENMFLLPVYTAWLYNRAPGAGWGGLPGAVERWLDKENRFSASLSNLWRANHSLDGVFKP
jgi:hypothetical protein